MEGKEEREESKPKVVPTEQLEHLHKYWYPEKSVNGLEVARKGGLFSNFDLRRAVLSLFSAGVVAGVVFLRFQPALRAAASNGVRGVVDAARADERTWMVFVGVCAAVALCLVYHVVRCALRKRDPVYLVDFSVLHPPDDMKMDADAFDQQTERIGCFTPASLEFQKRLNHRTGIGDEAYLPRPFLVEKPSPADFNLENSRKEAELVITGCCDDLFAKTGLSPQDIDIVIFNCSLFCPTPSLSAMLMNHYHMSPRVKNYQLGGMGCSAGLVSIDLARDLLAVYPNKNVLVFSTENITMNWYQGQLKGMLLSNTLFRVGGAAILLSNKPEMRSRSKYELVTTVRVTTAGRDDAYNAIFQRDDDDGKRGVKISRDLVKTVSQAMTINLTRLGIQILPLSEKLRFAVDWVRRRLSKTYREAHKPYLPNFRKAAQHFCIHAGGRAIIDGIQENLGFTDDDCTPSRATLYRYGNTSSSSVWYEMNYIEGRGWQRRGDLTLQLAFGSGLKCNTAVWRALRTLPPSEELPDHFVD